MKNLQTNNSKHMIGVIWYEENKEAGGRIVFFCCVFMSMRRAKQNFA